MKKITILFILFCISLSVISCADRNRSQAFDPLTSSIFRRAEAEFDISYQYAGENLAKDMTVERAHQALMNSSGHRKNILNPDFTDVGIGVKRDEEAYIYVEMFIGVPR